MTSILFHYYLITRTIEQDLSLYIYIYIYTFTANRIDDRYNNGWNFGRRAGREGGGVTECAPSSELLIKLNPMAPLDCIGGGKIILWESITDGWEGTVVGGNDGGGAAAAVGLGTGLYTCCDILLCIS